METEFADSETEIPRAFFGQIPSILLTKLQQVAHLDHVFFLPQVAGFHRQVPFRTAGDALLGRRNLEIEFEEQP